MSLTDQIPNEKPIQPVKRTGAVHVLNDGKENFLRFLRNLTPQILLVTFAVVSYAKSTIAPDGWDTYFPLGLSITFIVTFFFAAFLSVAQFLEGYAEVTPSFSTNSRKVHHLFWDLIKFTIKNNILVFEIILLMVIMELCVCMALFFGMYNGAFMAETLFGPALQ